MRVSLDLDRLTEITRRLVREHRRGLAVVNITSTEGGSDRVELLITIDGCHKDPCRFLINVNRAEPLQFEGELSVKLHDAFRSHQRQQSDQSVL